MKRAIYCVRMGNSSKEGNLKIRLYVALLLFAKLITKLALVVIFLISVKRNCLT